MLKEGPETPRKREPIDIPSRKPMEMDRHRHDDDGPGLPWGWIILGLIVVGAIAFLAIPAIRGYTTYAALHDYGVPEQYVSDIQGLADAYARTGAELNITKEGLATCTTGYATCTQDLNGQKALVESLGVDLVTRGGELETCNQLSAEKDAAVADAARRICCIQRVENPAISGYALIDGKISCVTDGGDSIDC